MSQHPTPDAAAETAFKEIRLLLLHGPWGIPGRTTRLAHLFDILAMADSPDNYFAEVPRPENKFDLSIWQTTPMYMMQQAADHEHQSSLAQLEPAADAHLPQALPHADSLLLSGQARNNEVADYLQVANSTPFLSHLGSAQDLNEFLRVAGPMTTGPNLDDVEGDDPTFYGDSQPLGPGIGYGDQPVDAPGLEATAPDFLNMDAPLQNQVLGPLTLHDPMPFAASNWQAGAGLGQASTPTAPRTPAPLSFTQMGPHTVPHVHPHTQAGQPVPQPDANTPSNQEATARNMAPISTQLVRPESHPQTSHGSTGSSGPLEPGDEFRIPAESEQIAILKQGREGHKWSFWEQSRFIERVCGPEAPPNFIDMLLRKNDIYFAKNWQPIIEETFFNSHTIGALHAQLVNIKKTYANCVAYEKYTGGDGSLTYRKYDRNLPKPTLLKLIGHRLDLAHAAGASVGNITREEYLAWTFDMTNGLFALLDKQFHGNPSIVRKREYHGSTISARAPTSRSRLSRAPASHMRSPRDTTPIIDEDNGGEELYHKRTPTSSLLDSGLSAPRSTLSCSQLSSRIKNQGSTQPTSTRTKLSAHSDPGTAPPPHPHPPPDDHRGKMIEVAQNRVELERARVQILGSDMSSGLQVQVGQRLAAMHSEGREDIISYYQMTREVRRQQEQLVRTVRTEAGLEGESGAAADKALAQLINNPPVVPTIDEWLGIVGTRGDQLWKKSEEAVRTSVATSQLAPSDSASVVGHRVGNWLAGGSHIPNNE